MMENSAGAPAGVPAGVPPGMEDCSWVASFGIGDWF